MNFCFLVNGLDLGKMQEMDPQITDPRLNSTVLNGLTADQTYRVHMWGRTENGRGEASFIELKTAKPAGMSKESVNKFIFINSTVLKDTYRSRKLFSNIKTTII